MLEHLTENEIICNEQYGVIPKRSTSLQLLNVMEEWAKILDSGGNINVIYCDIMKAFDQVPIDRLLTKVNSYGIKGSLLAWIGSFLKNRTMSVVINGDKSSEGSVTSGVPQGSVLGPLLFAIFINDLPLGIDSLLFMFADDTKLFREIKNQDDNAHLQQDLDELSNWSEKWKLKFHPGKCSVLHLGKTNKKTSYELNGQVLHASSSEKDLGVQIDDDLRFDEHIQAKTSKARQIWGMIRRTFTFIDTETFPLLFKALVRPHLEYANCVWSPRFQHQIDDIEKVQRSATKQVPGLQNMTYPERLKILKLPTLKHRRRRGDLIETYKIVHQLYDEGAVPGLNWIAANSITRGHQFRMRPVLSQTKIGQNRFTSRIVNDWNSLPSEIVSAFSLNSFKNQLDLYFEDDPSVYTI